LTRPNACCRGCTLSGRGIKAKTLIRQIVGTVLHDNLVDAVLDDNDEEARSPDQALAAPARV
jgi:hypothetical protein